MIERSAMASVLLFGTLFAARVFATGSLTYGFLVWNLTLASVPVLLALAVDYSVTRGARWAGLGAFLCWLVFLPNAPYVITDLMHLRQRDAPLWYDAALVGSAGLAGIICGAVSTVRVHGALVRTRLGRAGGLACVALASLASGFGIYLGRFARLNTWDIVTDPAAVASCALPPLLDPFAHTRVWGVTAVFAVVTAAGFLIAAGMRETPEPTRRKLHRSTS